MVRVKGSGAGRPCSARKLFSRPWPRMRSSRRPGVATSTEGGALRNRCTSSLTAVPPSTAWLERSGRWCLISAAHCSSIWVASSRVGESTIACTPRGSVPARAASRSTVGSKNASVLPEPVLALAMTSWPARASGSACDCTSVHSTKRRTSLIARFEATEMESSLNACTGPTLVDGGGASFFVRRSLADGGLGRVLATAVPDLGRVLATAGASG